MHVFPGLTPPRGVLLYGPSGTGKSLLARTVINESGVYSISLNGPDVLSRYVASLTKVCEYMRRLPSAYMAERSHIKATSVKWSSQT